MVENPQCTYKPVATNSEGRATCPPHLRNTFQNNDNCQRCPKALNINRAFGTTPQQRVERIADMLSGRYDRPRQQY